MSQLSASGGVLVAAGSSSVERARAFAAEAGEHGFPNVTAGTYDEVLADPGVDAVYIATVHTGHADLVLAALRAGKAVLCEKPLTPDHRTTTVLVDAARRAGLPLVEAFMYRFHPQTAALLDLVRDGAVGTVTHVDAAFAFRVEERSGRLFDVATAGGGILDVGCYPVTMTAAIVQAATGTAAAEPVELSAVGTIGPTGVDEWTVANATYASGITASLRTGIRVEDANAVVVHGSRGTITLRDPWTIGGGAGHRRADRRRRRHAAVLPGRGPVRTRGRGHDRRPACRPCRRTADDDRRDPGHRADARPLARGDRAAVPVRGGSGGGHPPRRRTPPAAGGGLTVR
ncbi:Gfo/Idh/MocA family oxidoreductase [Curtobacterium sp. MCJR17_043]|nr:Gfo/Idh/MocA family oxidoreductase [Curtobacterium sp. MCJR17_043]WIB37065.1 Gfo/Idh/MocA family oxidoreductase [Curtobacterium sp. MCJR17_043]